MFSSVFFLLHLCLSVFLFSCLHCFRPFVFFQQNKEFLKKEQAKVKAKATEMVWFEV